MQPSAETFMSDETERRAAEESQPYPTASCQNHTPMVSSQSDVTGTNNSSISRKPQNQAHHQASNTHNDDETHANQIQKPLASDHPHDQRKRAQETIATVQILPQESAPKHVAVSAPEDGSGSDHRGSGEPRPSDTGRASLRDRDVRSQASGQVIPRCVGRPGMGAVHGSPLPVEHQRGTSTIPEVCGIESGGTGESAACGATNHIGDHQVRQHQAQGQEQVPGKGIHAHLFAGWGRRMGHGTRDVHARDYGHCWSSIDGRDACNAAEDAAHGRCAGPSDHVHRGPGNQGEDPPACSVREDWEADVMTSMHHESMTIHKWVQKLSQELQKMVEETRQMGSAWTLGEVMCSNKSPLTQQVQMADGQAFRFGLEQGDLAEPASREKLFKLVCRHRPRHLWYSPTCGPWSSWSQLNASKSLEHQQWYQEKRHSLLYQIALGIVLYRHQVARGNHFHWEQPQKSLMFKNPCLSEVHAHTQICQFDMCRAGELRDPQSQMYMKKGMSVITTFAPLYDRLHGMTCSGNHVHQAIEGSCINKQGERMLRSEFTEIYPRKFARTVAQLLTKCAKIWPYNWRPGMLLSSCTSDSQSPEVALAVKGKFREKPKFELSELVSPEALAKPRAKKARTATDQLDQPSLDACRAIIQNIDAKLPRVGRREITDNEIINQLQVLFHDKQICRVMACRGTERTMGPPSQMHPLEAPYRRMLLLRRNGNVQYEKNWEAWTNLSQRQLIRPSHSSRINVTVFAKNLQSQSSQSRHETNIQSTEREPSREHSSDQAATDPNMYPTSGAEEPQERITETPAFPPVTIPEVPPDRPMVETDNSQLESKTAEPSGSEMKEPGQNCTLENQTNLQTTQQSFRFLSLPKWEQQMILRLHKNLGHPSNDRLSRALQINGSRPEIVQAALEIKCPVCAANAPPKHSRPAHLKTLMDFNHKMYLDGVTWTNRQGKSFHFYHMLDAGSNYHVAITAPSKTTTDLINIINQHWISWAGPPTELTIDSGTEMNSETFEEFTQRFGIKCQTTCPEAHWQNGKIERHGQFLQNMLSKIDLEYPIDDYVTLQMALNQSTHAKNSLSIRRGYAPEVIVFGKHTRLIGSILSDESIPSHEQALQEDGDISSHDFKNMLQVREIARRAFHTSDNNDVLRRAWLSRPCPSRGSYQKGDWVMIWKSNNLHQHQWKGPYKVIIQEAQHTVWCTGSGKLYRSAPENTRHAFPEEGSPEGPDMPEDTTPISHLLQNSRDHINNNPEEIIPNVQNNNPSIPMPESRSPVPMSNPEANSPANTVPQPDQEPDNISPENSQNEQQENSSRESADNSADDQQELAYLLSQEEENALTCKGATGLAWRCEIEVPTTQIQNPETLSEEDTWILMATTSKKQRSEVKLSQLTKEEILEFEQAKESEVQNWVKTGTISAIMRDKIPEEQILRCRWILTWKPLDPAESQEKSNPVAKTHKPKARIVVLGYLDPRIEEIPRDSPTLNKTSRMLALQAIATHAWTLRSFDIKAAFLQGQPQSDRIIAVDPVPELRRALGLTSKQICKLNKGAYGLIDAPYLWYCALVTELVALGFEACPFDPCFFVLRTYPTNDQPKLEGVLGIHVDDGIGGGSELFESKIKQLEAKFPFGSHKVSAFTFTGIEVNQNHDHSITLNQSSYVKKINSITIESNRKTQPELPVTESERLALRGLVGSLQYAAINTRPDLSSKLSFLQSSINSAKIETLQEANRVLHEAKRHHDVAITVKAIPAKDFRLMAFSDASFSSANKPDSHAGSIIVGTHQDISKNCQSPISPLTWGCRKIQKVVTSTLSAETIALASTLDHLAWLRLFWAWIHDPTTEWKHPEEALKQLQPAITVPTLPQDLDLAITDCKSLYDLVTRTAPPNCSEYRVQLVARAIKEALREGTQLRWVHGGAQLADSLTKAMESHFLRATLKHGFYKLYDEAATLKERAKTKDRLRWLKENHESGIQKSLPS